LQNLLNNNGKNTFKKFNQSRAVIFSIINYFSSVKIKIMKHQSINRGQSFFKLLFLTFLFSNACLISAQEGSINSDPYFDGAYLGISIGSQNIFGGALINDLDVLGQKSGLVVEFAPGFRKQIGNDRLVLGLEIQYGITDGDLEQTETRNQMKIDYDNNSQFGYGLNVGAALGKRKNILLSSYAYVTKRNFDITITETTGSTFTQKDGQRFLRYGLTLESPIYKRLHIKTSIGRIYVDYEDLDTNMDVDDKWDLTVGVNYQF